MPLLPTSKTLNFIKFNWLIYPPLSSSFLHDSDISLWAIWAFISEIGCACSADGNMLQSRRWNVLESTNPRIPSVSIPLLAQEYRSIWLVSIKNHHANYFNLFAVQSSSFSINLWWSYGEVCRNIFSLLIKIILMLFFFIIFVHGVFLYAQLIVLLIGIPMEL